MSRLRGFLLDGLSRLLEPDTKDIVIGDLAELNLGSLRSARELCGLIVRQQVGLWSVWRPWLALLCIAGVVGIRLNFLASSLMGTPWRNLSTYLKYGPLRKSGLTAMEEIIVWLSLAVAVVLWSWTAGFACTSLSRKTAPVTGTLLCIVWLCWSGFLVARALFVVPWFYVLLWLIPSPLFFLPAVLGARRAFRAGDLSIQQAMGLLVVTVCLIALVTWTSGWPQAALERWSEGVMHGGGMPWYRRLLPYLLLSWPAAWIAANNARHRSIAVLLVLTVLPVAAQSPDALTPQPQRKEAPDFTLTDATGHALTLSAYKGKVVLLDFWATWCGGCKVEIPWYVEFDKKYRHKGLAVIGVSMDEKGMAIVKPFLAQRKIEYPVVIGNDGLANQYNMTSMPLTLLIDRDGRVALSHAGVVDKDNFESNVRTLLRYRRPK